ncbi:hypothetical protein L7F22_009902 [Adiantum nelumboides]|nr:hypothetical protein [Adiantum nelumboides]
MKSTAAILCKGYKNCLIFVIVAYGLKLLGCFTAQYFSVRFFHLSENRYQERRQLQSFAQSTRNGGASAQDNQSSEPILEKQLSITSEGGRFWLSMTLLHSSYEEERKQRRTELFGIVSDDGGIQSKYSVDHLQELACGSDAVGQCSVALGGHLRGKNVSKHILVICIGEPIQKVSHCCSFGQRHLLHPGV